MDFFRTWLEPSKEVASFIYSTLKSLTITEVPELKMVGLQVRGIISLVKPVILGKLNFSLDLVALKQITEWRF